MTPIYQTSTRRLAGHRQVQQLDPQPDRRVARARLTRRRRRPARVAGLRFGALPGARAALPRATDRFCTRPRASTPAASAWCSAAAATSRCALGAKAEACQPARVEQATDIAQEPQPQPRPATVSPRSHLTWVKQG